MVHYDIRDKVALITGGARGIGFAIGRALERRGARVALVDLDGGSVADAAARLGRESAVGLVADVADAQAVDRAMAATVERFGGLDIVVANAGIAPGLGPMHLTPAEEFERVIDVNLLGVYRTVRAGMDQVIARRGQAVVVSSVYAFVNGAMLSSYAIAKAGVEQLGRALRLELSQHGASATVAYFGFVDTEMVRQGFETRRSLLGDEEELFPQFMRRAITPDQAAEAVAVAIERRRPRVIAPRWWAVGSVLRGVLGPAMDALGERSERLQDQARRIEAARLAEAGQPAAETTAPAQGRS